MNISTIHATSNTPVSSHILSTAAAVKTTKSAKARTLDQWHKDLENANNRTIKRMERNDDVIVLKINSKIGRWLTAKRV
jgi:hypothetical protein